MKKSVVVILILVSVQFGQTFGQYVYPNCGEQYACGITPSCVPTEDDCFCERSNSPNICLGQLDNCRFSNEENCSMFIWCQHEFPINSSCPSSQIFDPDDNKCVTGQCDKCFGKKDGDRLPHPTSCRHFYMCIEQKARPVVCPEGNYFDAESENCLKSSEVLCPADDPCNNQANGVMIPSESYCNAFYFCLDGIGHPRSCQYPLHFNPATSRCDTPANANCPISDTTPDYGICYDKPDLTVFPDPEQCSSYLICFGGRQFERHCPTNYNFHPEKEICVPSDSFECVDPGVCEPNVNGTFADPYRCSRFIHCLNGLKFHMACESGEHFSLRNGRCQEADGSCTISAPNCSNRIESINRPIFLHDPQDCSRFNICFNQILVGDTQECPGDYHFHIEEERCMPRETVNCENFH